MTQPKPPPKTGAPKTNQTSNPEPEINHSVALNKQVQEYQAMIAELQKEIKILRGRYSNVDPRQGHALNTENQALRAREPRLERALFALLKDERKPRNLIDEKMQYELLKKAALDYFSFLKVDPALWKSLTS